MLALETWCNTPSTDPRSGSLGLCGRPLPRLQLRLGRPVWRAHPHEQARAQCPVCAVSVSAQWGAGAMSPGRWPLGGRSARRVVCTRQPPSCCPLGNWGGRRIVAGGRGLCAAVLADPARRRHPLGRAGLECCHADWPGARGNLGTFRPTRSLSGHAVPLVGACLARWAPRSLVVAGAIGPARALDGHAPCGIFARQAGRGP